MSVATQLRGDISENCIWIQTELNIHICLPGHQKVGIIIIYFSFIQSSFQYNGFASLRNFEGIMLIISENT